MVTRDINILTDLLCTPKNSNRFMDIYDIDLINEQVRIYDVRTDREYTLKFSEVNFLVKERD